ncbi:ribonuclease P protein component [Dyadobacter tibetensis]|uniref:ribonuclease P protein component n=1 Tax=Dyadobacter tibetensis TaxID=1211851 RepID=UPI0009FE0429|nr:ribonuclease P protein component [Dyadobacter tibetensis]
MKQTFSKNERLCSPKLIGRLFQRGSSEVHTFYLFPFRVLYIYDPQQASQPTQVLFSVSKRQFKKAVDRNLIRRRCREAYRLHKALLYTDPDLGRPSYVAFLYLAKDISTFSVIDTSMQKLLVRLRPNTNGRP